MRLLNTTKNDTSEVYGYGSGKFGAEPVFVPAEGAQSEDEGYLLSLVYNQETDNSDLIILNAKEPKSGPLATGTYLKECIWIPWRMGKYLN